MSMPWDRPYLDGWMIVGMNHYRLEGKKHLFVSMTKTFAMRVHRSDGVVEVRGVPVAIVAEGTDEDGVFERLEAEARKATPL